MWENKKMKFIALIISFIFVLPFNAFSVSERQKETREDRELAMAENAILTSIIVGKNPASQYLCTQNAYACMGPSRAYLALALIAAKNSSRSLESLANVLRYRIDGALSEDYDCYVLSKGKTIVPYLQKLNPEELAKKCKDETNQVLQKNKGLFKETTSAEVCSEPTMIKEQVKDLLHAIRNSAKCHPDDF